MFRPILKHFFPKDKNGYCMVMGKFRAFNYLDTLLHYMLNLHVPLEDPVVNVEDMEEIKEHLKEHPKPSFPRHKLWSRHKAAKLIQKNVRGWLVRKRPEVQEMREFWKVMRKEMETRKGPAIPRPLTPGQDISNLYLEAETSSETDGTLYNDAKDFSKAQVGEEEDDEEGFTVKGMRLPPLDLTEKNILRLASMSPDLREGEITKLWEKYHLLQETKKESTFMREMTCQTDSTPNNRPYSPYIADNFQLSVIKSVNKDQFLKEQKKLQKERGTSKPEISVEDLGDVKMSFENLNEISK